MSETLSLRNGITAGVLSAAALMTVSACGENPSDNNNSGEYAPAPESDINKTVRLAVFRIKLAGLVSVSECNEVQRKVDLDCDGTVNSLDLSPMQKDFLDLDSDFITDRYDMYPGQNDWKFDADADGIIDAFDQYGELNDLVDSDGDGILNINDSKPQIPQSLSSEQQDFREMSNNVAYYAQMNEQVGTFLEFDSSPLTYEAQSVYSDSDGDGAFDVDDSDPYDQMQGGNLDPWDPSSDAWIDDDNNGWDSDY